VSHYLREEIITRLRVSPDKVKAIHNGVSFESTTASVPTDSLRSRLNVPGNTTIIGCVGNVRASKGYEFMIEAARELDRRGYEFRLLIAGQTGGALFTELTAAVIEGGLSDRVSFLGFCDDVRSFLREIDIYVLPSTTEGLSISTIEAMAAGKPVVVTRSGGPTEIVEDNSTGLTVPVSDANAIAEKVAYLIDNPTDAKEIADRGMKSVRKRFDLKISMAKYESLYGELLDKE
jgi:glycosyltransferase involved in cell wall biosynthesis